MNHWEPWSLHRRFVLAAFATLGASTIIGGNQVMAAVQQNTLKRRGVGLRAGGAERASPGFTLFAPRPVSVQRRGSSRSRLERQGALGSAPSGPPSSRYPAAQWQRAAALHG